MHRSFYAQQNLGSLVGGITSHSSLKSVSTLVVLFFQVRCDDYIWSQYTYIESGGWLTNDHVDLATRLVKATLPKKQSSSAAGSIKVAPPSSWQYSSALCWWQSLVNFCIMCQGVWHQVQWHFWGGSPRSVQSPPIYTKVTSCWKSRYQSSNSKEAQIVGFLR